MQQLFENEEYNYLVRYFERIGEDLFKTVIRTPENIEFPKSKTLSINTIKKLLETKENINPMYIEDEFTKMKDKVHEFNQRKYPGYEDMDIKLIISNIKGIEDFDALNDFYEDLKRQGYLKDIKESIKNIIDKELKENTQGKKQEDNTMRLEKGDVIKTALSENTTVLDVKDNQAILFSGTQFVLATGVKENKESGKFEWDN